MAEAYKKGQVIQIARGRLTARLTDKPLAKGELFLHVGSKEDISASQIKDLVTDKNLTTIFTGDLFAGANSKKQVYYIGSGGSLKWGGVSTASTWEEVQTAAKDSPSFIFMYCGTSTIYNTERNSDPPAQPTPTMDETKHSYVSSNSDDWCNEINPGDLFFYSPNLGHTVTLSLSRSSDALTKINVGALVSNSMQNWLADQFSDTTNPDLPKASTLKSFLDGPVRHYQYLIDNEGWNKVHIKTASTVTKNQEDGTVTVTAGEIDLTEDGDGFIHYVPFSKDNPGLNKYKVATTAASGYKVINGVDANLEIREGDLIFTIPNSSGTDKGGVHHAVVSLYGALLDLMKAKFDGRADAYATAIWSTGTTVNGVSYDGDLKYFAENSNIANFIDRLFKTKVDIDPITHKIISSQLPDYLLGAPKYMGRFTASEADWTTVATKTTGTDFAKWLLDSDSNASLGSADWENLDLSEDDTSGSSKADNVTDSTSVNDKLKPGCYWIYTGESADIGSLTSLFNLYDKDDYKDGDTTETDPDKTSQHLLNKGDWIIYNGETGKFDIIDNTASFIGILVHGAKLAGVVEFTDKEREATNSVVRYVDGTAQEAATFKANETKLEAKDGKTIDFTNPASVLFKNEDTVLTSSSFIPVITGEGWAYNSRFELINNETGLKVKWGESTSPVSAVSFTFFKEDDTDTPDYIFHDTAFKTVTETNGREVKTERIKTAKAGTTSGKDGLDFLEFSFAPSVDIYKFSMELVDQPDLYLPQYSGVLTTEEYVNNGFTVIKAVIEDLYSTLIDETTKGHVDWLQTVRNKLDDAGKPVLNSKGEQVKEIYDSKVRQSYTAGSQLLLDLFYGEQNPIGKYDENSSTAFARLSVYKKLEASHCFEIGLTASNAPLDYKLGAGDGEDAVVETLNPSEAQTGIQPENILPNHSGILLNNNSVIDGGEWL